MERSLSVLLPVHNAQFTLAATVQEVLDVVSELTEQFELVIVDDGSGDATSEVAHELTQHYPQVSAVFHRKCLGRQAAIRSGFQHCSGEIIFLCDETGGVTLDTTAKLWRAAGQHQPAASIDTPAARKWTRFSDRHPLRQAGYQMIDRRTMEEVHGSSKPIQPNYLARVSELALEK